MPRKILIWLGVLPDPRPHRLSPEGQAKLDRLEEMYADIGRLSGEQWCAKWGNGLRPADTLVEDGGGFACERG